MWSTGGCLSFLFLILTSFVATLALRSAWKARHEPPLTTLRLVLLIALIIAACIVPVVMRLVTPDVLMAMAAAIFVVSMGWLIDRGL